MLKDLKDNLDPILNEIDVEPFSRILNSYLKKCFSIVQFLNKSMEIQEKEYSFEPVSIPNDFIKVNLQEKAIYAKSLEFVGAY